MLLSRLTYSKNTIIKIFFLGLCFFFIIGSYTLLKELKDAIFIIIVGTKYLPDVKALSLLMMIPMVLFYSWLSEKIKRHHLLCVYALFYAIGAFIISYFIKNPLIGLHNTNADGSRIFGWVIYLFLEGCSPFLVSLNWSFLNSISKPGDVKSYYVAMAGMGKLGSFFFASFAWLLISRFFSFFQYNSDVELYSILLNLSGFSLLCVPFILLYLNYKLPSSEFIGYTDSNEKKEETNTSDKKFSFGFSSIFKTSYVLGIVGMMFCWETVNVIFNNLRLIVAYEEAGAIGDLHIGKLSLILFKSTVMTSLISLLFVIIGTNSIIRFLGEKKGLILIPLLTGSIIICFLFFQNINMVILTYTMIRTINLSLATPIRESLYIPTSKEIQFKSKSWIDSFGQKFSKGFGSLYNKLIQFVPKKITQHIQLSFFIIVITLWITLAYYLGKRWEKAVKNKEVIS